MRAELQTESPPASASARPTRALVVELGRIGLEEAVRLQAASREAVARGGEPVIFVVEHEPAYTVGRAGLRRAFPEGDPRRWPSIRDPGLVRSPVIELDRGGDVTWHGPGQAVIYPVLPLRGLGLSLKGYLRQLEAAGIAALARFGIRSERRAGLTGVWAGEAKIGFIGIGCRSHVSYHGMSLNASCDLSAFAAIVPCGIEGCRVTSVAELAGRRVPAAELGLAAAEALAASLGLSPVRVSAADLRRRLDVGGATPRTAGPRDMELHSDPCSVPGTSRASRPPWLVKRLPVRTTSAVSGILDELALATVCRSAKCPNLAECWSRGTATFMILGETCTRGCRFCAVRQGAPSPVDPDEPARVAEAARRLGLRHVVVTSVTRDDLPDGGAGQFAATVRAIHDDARATAEVLVPDFQGRMESVGTVAASAPEVFGHNVETVPRLYPEVRPRADYARSLSVLEEAASGAGDAMLVKSGLMLGLGERAEEVEGVLRDLRSCGCSCVTMGQYLSPGGSKTPVREWIGPERFEEYAALARSLGFLAVEAGSFVRSSYRASETCLAARAALAARGIPRPRRCGT